ncbi:MAG: cob(I)yrinic acid a,c-diamide adenosyltransferase [Dehalococcoidia bacterium]|nr:cob(I)yrinic acid a,c-diamide adenosyltransferase [Dehalococcoidia bacterium]
MVKIYTKTGDKGQTGLLYGGRVPKNDPRVETYGLVDEACSAMGLGRALSNDAKVKEILLHTQRELFTVGAELATDPSARDSFLKHFTPVTSEMTTRLERWIDELDAVVKLPPSFVIPGASPASAAIDVARTALRTAERRIVGLHEAGMLANEEVLRYVNRLADLLFMLARYEDRRLPPELLTGARI